MKENLLLLKNSLELLKNKIYKYPTSISKNLYIDNLDYIVNGCNNTYHRTITMKPIDIKNNTYIYTDKEVNINDPKFQIGDHVRISKYRNLFVKGYTSNWSEEYFVIKKVKIQFHVLILLMILMVKKLLEHYLKKNCKKQIKKNLE